MVTTQTAEGKTSWVWLGWLRAHCPWAPTVQPGPLCPQNPLRWASMGRKSSGWVQAKSLVLDGGQNRGYETPDSQDRCSSQGSWCGREASARGHVGFWASFWESLAKHKLFQQICHATGAGHRCSCSPPLLGTCRCGTSGAGAGEGGGTWDLLVQHGQEPRGKERAQAGMKLSGAWSGLSLILAQAQSKGIYF